MGRQIETNSITLAAGADDRYAEGLAVTMFSAVQSCSEASLNCVILDMGISSWNRERLSRALVQAAAGRAIKVAWIDPGRRFAGLPEPKRFSHAIYLRFLLADLLPDQRRCIYLDSDLLIRGDLGAIWRLDIGENVVAAVEDRFGPEITKYLTNLRNPQHGNEPYLNSGVLIMNLDAFRRERIGEKAIEFCLRHRAQLRFPDQDALNVLLARRWFKLDPTWNCLIKPNRLSGLDEARILHFVGPRKPWLRKRRSTGKLVRAAEEEYIAALVATGILSPLQRFRFWLGV